jgi:hypothetical protein
MRFLCSFLDFFGAFWVVCVEFPPCCCCACPPSEPSKSKSILASTTKNGRGQGQGGTFEELIQKDVDIGYEQVPTYYQPYKFEQKLALYNLADISRTEQFKRRKLPQLYGVGSPYFEVKFRNFFFYVSQSKLFYYLSVFMILFNALILCLYWDGAPKKMHEALAIAGDVCTWWFVVEIFIKLIGIGPVQFLFNDNTPSNGDSKYWARFDVIVVFVSLIPFFARRASGSGDYLLGIDPSVLRVLRIAKLSILTKHLGTESIVQTLIYSSPSILSIGFVMVCLLFGFAILGHVLFARVRFGNYLNEDLNFTTFGKSMLTLFVSITGENYNGIMSDLMISPPLCNPTAGDCGLPLVAPIYYIIFTILSSLLILNVCIAIVVNHYENSVTKALSGPSESERRKVAKQLRKEKRARKRRNQLLDVFDDIVNPVGDEDAFSTEVDEVLGFDFTVLSNPAVERFLRQWGQWRHAQIKVMWSNDQFAVIEEIITVAKEMDEKEGVGNGNDEISPNLQHAHDLIHYLFGALVYTGGISTSSKQQKSGSGSAGGQAQQQQGGNSTQTTQKAPKKSKKEHKNLINESNSSYNECKPLLDFQFESWSDMFRQLRYPDDDILNISINPVWMHVSNIIVFLNWCEAPLGFRNDPLSPAETMRMLSLLNIRQYHGYVHVAEMAIALLQSLYGNEVLDISPLNETVVHNKAALQKRYPQLSKLKHCKVNAGFYLCVIRAQRAIRRWLAKKRFAAEQQRGGDAGGNKPPPPAPPATTTTTTATGFSQLPPLSEIPEQSPSFRSTPSTSPQLGPTIVLAGGKNKKQQPLPPSLFLPATTTTTTPPPSPLTQDQQSKPSPTPPPPPLP